VITKHIISFAGFQNARSGILFLLFGQSHLIMLYATTLVYEFSLSDRKH
jgi:hypothetical protein